MAKTFRTLLVEVGGLCDLAVGGASLLTAIGWTAASHGGRHSIVLLSPLQAIVTTAMLPITWYVSLLSAGAYESFRLSTFPRQAIRLAVGAFVSALFTAMWLLRIRDLVQPWNSAVGPTVAAFWLLLVLGICFTRLLGRSITHALRRRGRNLRNYLIVGTNQRAVALAKRLEGNPDQGCRVIGFIDDTWYFAGAEERFKQRLIGGSDQFLRTLRSHPIDEVIVTLPIASSYAWTEQIVAWCLQQGVPVRSEGHLFDLAAKASAAHTTHKAGFITHHEAQRGEFSLFCKHALDIGGALLALVLFSPFFFLIALAIRLEGPGPVFFLQERLGENKRPFKIVKFRTMVQNAEAMMHQVEHLNETTGPTFKLAQDPRITRVGRVLRRTSLDELPQLLNVLAGEMSLVGPRPLPLRDYSGFSKDWHRRRFSVKPGLTCLWQVSGRSSIAFDRWMELDLAYIDQWSFGLDLKILLLTIPAVLRGSGAM